MLPPPECQKTADDLERAARRMTLKAHHDAYMVVATEWRSLAQAVESGPAAPTRASMEAREQHLADLRASANTALDSPLRRSILHAAEGWAKFPAAEPEPIPPA